MATFTPATPLTAEAFWQHHNDKRRELVRGEIVNIMPPGGVHGTVALRLGARLEVWATKTSAGNCAVESGYLLARNPDTLRSPDISFVKANRIPPTGVPRAFWPFAPDLAVEIVSPADTAAEVHEKILEYLAAGTASVWIVYPDTRRVVVHSPNGTSRTYNEQDELTYPDLLPGFSLRLSELFV